MVAGALLGLRPIRQRKWAGGACQAGSGVRGGSGRRARHRKAGSPGPLACRASFLFLSCIAVLLLLGCRRLGPRRPIPSSPAAASARPVAAPTCARVMAQVRAHALPHGTSVPTAPLAFRFHSSTIARIAHPPPAAHGQADAAGESKACSKGPARLVLADPGSAQHVSSRPAAPTRGLPPII